MSSEKNKGEGVRMIIKDKVSIIMSAYNEEPEWLKKSIESILCQTYCNFEFVIVLDNPKNTQLYNIIDEYARKDERIVFLKNETNMGLIASLNKALEFCSGKYIARMDADDISESNRIERQLLFLTKGNYDIVACRMAFIDENGNLISESGNFGTTSKKCIDSLSVRNIVPHPTWLVRKEVYDLVGNYNCVPTVEDYEWLCRAVCKGFIPCCMQEVLFRYRIRKGISVGKAYQQSVIGTAVRKEFRRAINKGEEFNSLCIKQKVDSINFNEEHTLYNRSSLIYKKGCNNLKNGKSILGVFQIFQAIFISPRIFEKLIQAISLKKINRL